MKIQGPKKGTLKSCGFFADHHSKFYVFSSLVQEIPHAISSTCSQFYVFKPNVCGFLLEYFDSEGSLGYDE